MLVARTTVRTSLNIDPSYATLDFNYGILKPQRCRVATPNSPQHAFKPAEPYRVGTRGWPDNQVVACLPIFTTSFGGELRAIDAARYLAFRVSASLSNSSSAMM